MQSNTTHVSDFKGNFLTELKKARKICSSNPIEGIKKTEELYAKAVEYGDEVLQAKALNNMGLGYYLAKKYPLSLEKLNRAINIFESHSLFDGISEAQNWKGLVLSDLGQSDKSLSILYESLNRIREYDIQDLKSSIYSNLGMVYSRMGNKHKAIEYFEQSLQNTETDNQILLSNIAATYHEIGEPQKALVYLLRAYKLNPSNEMLLYRGLILSNLMAVYLDLADYEKLLQCLQELKGFVKKLEHTFFKNVYHGASVEVYIKCQEISPSNETVHQILAEINVEDIILQMKETVDNSENLEINIHTSTSLVNYYKQLEDWKQVSFYQDKKLELNNKKFENEKMQTTERLHIQYEVAQKEQKIKIQELELEKKAIELEKKKELEQINLQLEEKVAKRTAKLTIQNQQLQEFAFIVSHDLREPLCNIHGISDLLTQTYQEDLSDELQLFLSQIGISAQRMNILLKDLLDYTILEQKIEASDLEEVDGSVVLKSVIDTLQSEIIEAKASISVDRLPLLKTSKYGIRLLFEQLLSNAIKFKSKTRSCIIQISYTSNTDFYEFAVKDNGEGIAEAHHETIFRPFRRLKKEKSKGTGIGLAICKKAVDILGGKIHVVSQLEKGSTFYFTIPKR